MDPNATWEKICTALSDHETETARAAIFDLSRWLRRDGSPPNGMTKEAALQALDALWHAIHK